MPCVSPFFELAPQSAMQSVVRPVMTAENWPSLPRTVQDLTPAGARLALRVQRHLVELGLQAGARLVAGCSGGADSTALAVLLRCLGFSVVLAHLDHGLRPESAAEARHVAALAAALDVPCVIQTENVAERAAREGQGLEEAGRVARYALFEDVRVKSGADFMATGHHLDDLCEDVLLRLVRGTGWPALGGMTALDAGRRLVRPLLPFRRTELEHFLQAHGLPWLTDASNEDPAFQRNRLRHAVMPLLLAENPRFPEAVLELHHMARQDAAHWEGLLADALTRISPKEGVAGATPISPLHLPRAALAPLDEAARLRLLLELVRRLPVGQARASTLRQVVKALGADARGSTGKVFQLPGGIELRLERDAVVACVAKEPEAPLG